MDCAIPDYGALQQYELPKCQGTLFSKWSLNIKNYFLKILRHTSAASHHIPTKETSIGVLPDVLQHITTVK